MMNQVEKARSFHDMHYQSQAFVMPNPWDAGSAKILASLGYQALATTSAGLAFSLGRPDGTNDLSRAEILENARAIVEAVELPVSADLEGGFGVQPETCAETIQMAAACGLVGGSIEDATGENAQPLFGIEQAIDRVRAAAETARALPFAFTFTARAENYLLGNPNLADTIKRLQGFQEAGAHVLYAPGLRTAAEIKSVVSSVDLPVNVVMGLQGADLTVAELSAIGVKRISLGSSLARAALGALMQGAAEVREQGSFGFARSASSYGSLNTLFSDKT